MSRKIAVDPRKKTGYKLRLSVVMAVRDAVREGAAESEDAFVERALIRELKEIRRGRVYDAYGEAARDLLFLEDMQSTTAAYDPATGDGL